MTEEERHQLALFRRISKRHIFLYEANKEEGLKGDLEAYRQRGWLRLEYRKFENPHPLLPSQQAYVLDADGRARLEGLERKLADEQPSAKVRRTGVFLASKLWELLLASIGSGLLGGVCGYLLRLFQEG